MSPLEVYRECRARGGLADLPGRLLLRFTGADRVRYLNGQVTANVASLAPGRALPACVTTAKGRLCAEVRLHAASTSLLLEAESVLRESLPLRMERYIIADDVQLEDVTETLRLVHLIGGVAPASDLVDAAILISRSHRFGREGWDLFFTHECHRSLWPQLSARLPVLDEALCESLRLEAGLPRWGFDLDESTLPPEAGLDRTHIDYHKGCYIGQEVISRLKSVGHVNRTLAGFSSPSGAPLRRGLRLFPPDSDERPVGELTSVGYSFALERPIALGYLRRGAAFPELFARPAEGPGEAISVATHALPFIP